MYCACASRLTDRFTSPWMLLTALSTSCCAFSGSVSREGEGHRGETSHVKRFKSREEAELTVMVILVEASSSPERWLTVRHFCRQRKYKTKFRPEAPSFSHQTSKSTKLLMDIFRPLCTKTRCFDAVLQQSCGYINFVQAKLMYYCIFAPLHTWPMFI